MNCQTNSGVECMIAKLSLRGGGTCPGAREVMTKISIIMFVLVYNLVNISS